MTKICCIYVVLAKLYFKWNARILEYLLPYVHINGLNLMFMFLY